MRVTEGMVHHRSVRAGTDGQDTLKLKAEMAATLLKKATCLDLRLLLKGFTSYGTYSKYR